MLKYRVNRESREIEKQICASAPLYGAVEFRAGAADTATQLQRLSDSPDADLLTFLQAEAGVIGYQWAPLGAVTGIYSLRALYSRDEEQEDGGPCRYFT
jgi:hypothetical protein